MIGDLLPLTSWIRARLQIGRSWTYRDRQSTHRLAVRFRGVLLIRVESLLVPLRRQPAYADSPSLVLSDAVGADEPRERDLAPTAAGVGHDAASRAFDGDGRGGGDEVSAGAAR